MFPFPAEHRDAASIMTRWKIAEGVVRTTLIGVTVQLALRGRHLGRDSKLVRQDQRQVKVWMVTEQLSAERNSRVR
jgi:hypothetical protein